MKKKTQTKRKNIKDEYETTRRRDFFLQKEKRREIHDNNYKKSANTNSHALTSTSLLRLMCFKSMSKNLNK